MLSPCNRELQGYFFKIIFKINIKIRIFAP